MNQGANPAIPAPGQHLSTRLSVVTTADRHLAHNEALIERLHTLAITLGHDIELIIVDDLKVLSGNATPIPPRSSPLEVSVIQPELRLGQLHAMLQGIAQAKGDVIITIDPDMHDNVPDITRLLDLHYTGMEVIYTWRTDRMDTPRPRRYLSRLYNWLLRTLFGVLLHDINTPMTLLSRRAVEALLATPGDVGLHKLYLYHLFSQSFTEMPISVGRSVIKPSNYSYLSLIRLGFYQLISIFKTFRMIRRFPSRHVN